MNVCILGGRITKDLELKTTQTGKSVCQFSLAVNRFGKDKEADFFNVVAWNALAETISKYCHKGDQIFIEGRLTTRSYEKDGQKRYITEVVANSMDFGAKKGATEPASSFGPDVDQDIPF